MKKLLRNSIVAVASMAVLLLGTAGVGMAGKPPAFGVSATVTKVTDGWNRAPGNKSQATDGTKSYSLRGTWEDADLEIIRSDDGGQTWLRPMVVANAPFQGAFTGVMAVSMSNDDGHTIVHVVWEQADDPDWESIGIYYSWADDANLGDWWNTNAWSTPVRINGNVPAWDSWARTSISTTPSGEIHVVYQGGEEGGLYYIHGANHDAEFDAPQALPGFATGWEDVEATLDPQGNLHVAYPITNTDRTQFGIEYTMKPAGSSNWSSPVAVAPLAVTEGQEETFNSIAAFDQDHVYIAAHDWHDLNVYSTADGGQTWLGQTLFAANEIDAPDRHLAIAVNSEHTVYLACAISSWASSLPQTEVHEDLYVYKSTNEGRDWAAPTVIMNQTSPSIGFTTSGKAAINMWGAMKLEGTINFTVEK